jgi:hypothetical protein
MSLVNDEKGIKSTVKTDVKIFKFWLYLRDFMNSSMSDMSKHNAE